MGDTILQLHDMRTHLRCRPGELYLYAITVNKRLQLNTFWDGNVYKEEIVQEWFNEIKNATDWYLVHD
jgi:hypothetical protein